MNASTLLCNNHMGGLLQRLQTRTKHTVNVLDTNLKRKKENASKIHKTTFSYSLRRHGLVRSVKHINLHYLLKFVVNMKYDSLHINLLLHSPFNSFTSDPFLKLVEYLKKNITNIKHPVLTFTAKITIIQSGCFTEVLFQSYCIV